ncbi:methyltransferase domain-containing protein [Sulfitobacter sp. JL08]|uniref:methyltransferase domain-containing protein n=1 Tax=Sulfitobacter sp. JL08 TaxID=2070369 RepID=UPI0013B3DE48|nr:methyltransferase domain-containing protein [Sulfitobacter sp. JL08]
MRTPFDAEHYWESRLSKRYDSQGVGDIGLPVSYNNDLYRIRGDAFSLALAKTKAKTRGARVLDIGSGTGFYVRQWIDCEPDILVGSDITNTAVEALSQAVPSASFLRCDIGGELPDTITGQKFDFVSAMDILFHIIDDAAYARAISNIGEMVHKGGHFIFSDNLSDRTIVHGPHQVSRAENWTRELLAQYGFTVIGTVPMFVFMNDPVRSKSRILRKLFKLTYRLAARGEGWGRVIGALWLPLERLSIRTLTRGPSTELFICRKV